MFKLKIESMKNVQNWKCSSDLVCSISTIFTKMPMWFLLLISINVKYNLKTKQTKNKTNADYVAAAPYS